MSPNPSEVDRRLLSRNESKEHRPIFRRLIKEIKKSLGRADLDYAGILVDTDGPVYELEKAEKAKVYCHPLGRDKDGKLFALGGFGFKDKFPVDKPTTSPEVDQLVCVVHWEGYAGDISYLVLDNHSSRRLRKIESYGNFFKVYSGDSLIHVQHFHWNEGNFCLLMAPQRIETEKHLRLIEGGPDKPNMKVMENMLQALKNACGAK